MHRRRLKEQIEHGPEEMALLILLFALVVKTMRLLSLPFARWPFVERRSEKPRYHLIGDEREPDVPVLTPRLALTITICAMVVVGLALAYVVAGSGEGLLLIPIFVAYTYVVLFARALALRLRRLFA